MDLTAPHLSYEGENLVQHQPNMLQANCQSMKLRQRTSATVEAHWCAKAQFGKSCSLEE